MEDGAQYAKYDYVDYFSACVFHRDVTEERIIRLYKNDRCFASVVAFVRGGIPLGKILWYLTSDLEDLFPEFGKMQSPKHKGKEVLRYSLNCSRYAEVIFQAARRHELPPSDARSLPCSSNLIEKYRELFNKIDQKSINLDFWKSMDEKISAYEFRFSNSKNTWRVIKKENQEEYLNYWKVANFDDFLKIIKNRKYMALFHSARQTHPEYYEWPEDIDSELKNSLGDMDKSLRLALIGKLMEEISRNILVLPEGLKEQFPELYVSAPGA